MKFGLVHSPLVGPTTWRWIADTLSTAGYETVVPDLRVVAAADHPYAVITAAVAAIPQEWAAAVIVGHSAAGSIIPSIAVTGLIPRGSEGRPPAVLLHPQAS